MPPRYAIMPGFILSLAIVETLAERDPAFLPLLRAKLAALRQARAGDENAVTTIDAFLKLLDDPRARRA